MNRFAKRLEDLLFTLSSIALALALILVVVGQFQYSLLYTCAFILLAISIVVFRKQIFNVLFQADGRPRFVFFVVLGALLFVRLLPLVLSWTYHYDVVLKDTAVHYNASMQLAKGGLDAGIMAYEKMYPYLFPYSLALSLFVRLLGSISAAIVVSNVMFDALGGLFFYLLVEDLKPSAGFIGTLLWFANPFSIVFCYLSLNIVLVNMFAVLIALIGHKLLIAFNAQRRALRWALLFGLVVYFANLFRPVFTVALVAILICIIIRALKGTRGWIPVVVGLVVALALPTAITRSIVAAQYNDDLIGSSGGWSFFVGANYDTHGKWSPEDSTYYFQEIVPQYETVSGAQDAIKSEGIERWAHMGPGRIVKHLFHKLCVLFCETPQIPNGDLDYQLGLDRDTSAYRLVGATAAAFVAALLALSLCMHIKASRDGSLGSSVLYLDLCFMGLIAGFMLVEVMDRYQTILYPFITCFAALYLSSHFVKVKAGAHMK